MSLFSFAFPFVSRRRHERLQSQFMAEKVAHAEAVVGLVDWQDRVARLEMRVQCLNTSLKLAQSAAARALQRTQRIPHVWTPKK
jgi:hypothetical protein